jgi:pyrroline-5-carboxylate reductase
MKISIIGAGAMGGAIAEGLIKGDYIQNEDICVSDPARQTRDKFANMGITATPSNQLAAQGADVVCVVVKPWLVEQVLKGIRDVMDYDRQILIVVAAGVKSESIKAWMTKDGGKLIPTFLVIPNIAIAQLASMTFIAPAMAVEQPHIDVVTDLFDAMGKTILTDEQHLGAGTTLASCGIAYAMRYIRAASEGGVELGFKADEAKQIVMQTMKGAVTLLEATGLHPEAAIDLVTTPGGVTIKGLNEMEHNGFTSSVIKGLKAGAKS